MGQHAAGEVGDLLEPRFSEHQRRLRRARARAAHHHDRPFARELAGILDQAAERDQLRAGDVAERPVEFVELAHVEHLHVAQMFLEPVGMHFPDAGEGVGKRRPIMIALRPAVIALRA